MKAIRVENLSKKYLISHQAPERYTALRDVIASGMQNLGKRMRSPFGRGGAESRATQEEFFALRDVSFEITPGERVGIIGRNGAGKSTLLKVLSRITEPSSGRISIAGRVASLLEVGTGFHPELTGRENIFLNGAILGMGRGEIRKKFDEIVAFAEVERFLDTPVKRYSSGMYVRLAFAVAAHLEPDILVVDEVLAVGDAQFQRKCLGKMQDGAMQGRTVLFVSHNMTALQSLCERAIWLDQGGVIADGEASSVAANYLHTSANSVLERIWSDSGAAPGNEIVRLLRVSLVPEQENQTGIVYLTTRFRLEFVFRNFLAGAQLNFSMHFYTLDGSCAFNSCSMPFKAREGEIRGVCHIPSGLLNSETYRVKIMVVRDQTVPIYDHPDALIFDVRERERAGGWHGRWAGVVRPSLQWDIE